MPSLCDYRQLVLVDIDDGRLSLFKDHQKYLSHMAPNCEWCLFWNDLRLPVYKKLKSATRPYFRIHLCPSYHQRPTNSLNPDLLDFLETLVPKFSFVLLVHGYKQNYTKAVRRMRSQYGEGKIEVHKISECSSQYLPSILNLLVERNAASSIHQSVTNVSSNDHLKFRHKPGVFRCEWPDSLAALPYGLIELIYYKQLIKRKQKRLNIYFSKACPINNTFLQQASIGYDEVGKNESYPLTTVFESKSVMKLRIISYKTFTTLTQERSQNKYSMEQYSLSAEQTEAKFYSTPVPKLQKKRKNPKQKRPQPVKKSPQSNSQEVSCSRCTKKFKDQVAQKNHFGAKHSKSTAHQAPSQRQASLPDDSVWVHHYDNYINYLFEYPPLSDYYRLSHRGNASITAAYINPLHTTYRQAILQRRISALMINGQTSTTHQPHSILPTSTAILNPSQKNVTTSTTQSTIVQFRDNPENKVQPCLQHTQKTKRKTAIADHFFIKHAISSHTTSPKKMDRQSNLVEERTKWNHTDKVTKVRPVNMSHHSSLPQPPLNKSRNDARADLHSTTKHSDRTSHFTASSEAVVNTATIVTKSHVRIYPCSRCSKKCKSARERLDHFIKAHSESFLSTPRSTECSFIDSRTCWECNKVFKSSDGQISHFIDKHAQTISLTQGDPSSLLQTKISMAHEKMTAAKAKDSVAGKFFSCSKCTMRFKYQADLQSHVAAKHSNFSAQQFSSQAQTAVQDKTAVVMQGSNLMNNSLKCSQPTNNCVSFATVDDQAAVAHTETDHQTGSAGPRLSESQLIYGSRSAIDHELEVNANLTRPILSTACTSPSLCNYQMELAQEQTQMKETRNTSTDKLLSCSQCTKTFQSIADIKQHFDCEHTSSAATDAPSTIADSADVVIDQATLVQICKADEDPTENPTQRSSLSHPHSDKDRASHCTASSEAVVNTATIVTKDHVRIYPCSRCSKKCKSARERLDHFIKAHSESFLSTPRSTECSFIDSRTCWECDKVFKSSDGQISHFIDKHAQTISLTQGDPSSLLQTKISMAQEKLMCAKGWAQSTNIATSNSSKIQGLKADMKCYYYAHNEKSESTLTRTLEALNCGEHKTATKKDAAPIHHPSDKLSHGAIRSEECVPDGLGTTRSKMKHWEQIATATTKSIGDTVGQRTLTSTVAQSLDGSERCQKESSGHNDTIKINVQDNTTTASTGRIPRNLPSGQDSVICPRARSSPIVYIQLKTIREQLIITPGRTNRCPFKDCTSETVEYEIEALDVHTLMEHKDAALKLECCNPTRTYTLEEYKNHLESASPKNMG